MTRPYPLWILAPLLAAAPRPDAALAADVPSEWTIEVDGKPAELLGADWVRLPRLRSGSLTILGRFADE